MVIRQISNFSVAYIVFAVTLATATLWAPLVASARPEVSLPSPSRVFDVNARRQAMAALTLTEQVDFCGAQPILDRLDYQTPRAVVLRPHPRGLYIFNTLDYVAAIHAGVETFIGNGDTAALAYLKQIILDAANDGAFTLGSNNTAGPRFLHGPREPAFVQAILLIPISHAIEVLRSQNQLDSTQLATIESWGKLIFDRSKNVSDRTINDVTAAKAAAYMTWGAAIGDNEIFQNGLQRFDRVASTMRDDGSYEIFIGGPAGSRLDPREYVRASNQIVGWMTIAAEAAAQNGIDAYGFEYGGSTLHDSVQWHVNASTDPRSQSRTPPNQNLRHMARRKVDSVFSFAWVEPYLSRFPDEQASITALEAVDRIGSGEPLYSGMYGGTLQCYYRPTGSPGN